MPLKKFSNNPNKEYIINKEGNLQSREIAKKYIFLKNRDKYPLPFKAYVVHHIDGDTFNNSIRNLYICLSEQHNLIHREQIKRKRKFSNFIEIDNFLNNKKILITNEDKKKEITKVQSEAHGSNFNYISSYELAKLKPKNNLDYEKNNIKKYPIQTDKLSEYLEKGRKQKIKNKERYEIIYIFLIIFLSWLLIKFSFPLFIFIFIVVVWAIISSKKSIKKRFKLKDKD